MVDAHDLQTVRSRLGVHFDKHGNIRNQCLRAALCVSLTEAHQGTVTEIEVTASGSEFVIVDNSEGLSLEALPGRDAIATEVMSLVGGCGEHKPHPQYAEILCSTSIAEVNAISSAATLATMVNGVAWAQKYAFGIPSAPFKKVNRDSKGNRFRFQLDKRYAGASEFDLKAVEKEIRSLGLKLDSVNLVFKES